MSLNLKANCYGFAVGCRKLYFSFVGHRMPKKVGKHWTKSSCWWRRQCFLGSNPQA